ncbi:MAG: c-type cytochrome, partial [Thauera sp.]
ANAAGESVYKKVCALCHSSGVAGAPIPGNKDEWAPRIAQGNDMLYKHAIEGFTGEKGMMPPRGGGTSLKDDEVKAAVDFMVAKSK